MRMVRLALSTVAVVTVGFAPERAAMADVQHVVGRGHTVEAIANRYHVTAKSIIEANHLKDVRHLKPGDVLTIPKAESHDAKKAHKDEPAGAHDADKKTKALAKDKDKADHGAAGFAAKAKTPGVVHMKRAASAEEADLKVSDRGGRIAATTLKSFEKLMRSQGGASHPIEARLISLVGVVSNHFGSRKIEIVSGFRPYTPTQYTAHSNHNHGKAIDFRVVGVPNEAVRDFCRTLKNVGCGYYPNSTFVHMDVRDSSAFWIDFSKPGEPPRYNAANVEADEGTSDVHGGEHPSANTPAPAPAEDPAPGTPSESEPPPATKPTEE